MRAGRLRNRVTIERRLTGLTPTGEARDEWQPLGQTWAAIEPLSGREYVAGLQVQSEITHTVRLRYFDGLESSMRVVKDGRRFELVTVINTDERGAEHVCMAKETQ